MSLLSKAMQSCILYKCTRTQDEYGGYKDAYFAEKTILCAITYNSSSEQQKAQQSDSTGLYTITTTKDITLKYHDVLKRESDEKIFRVTENGDDNCTPNSARLNMRQVNAEEWSFPDE